MDLSLPNGGITGSFLFERLKFKFKEASKSPSNELLSANLCPGVQLANGYLIKSLLFSTDLALIENSDADAVLAVYPYSPSEKLMEALLRFAGRPVFCGIGGGLTQGKKSLYMARKAEDLGAAAIVVNQPFKNKDIEIIKRHVKIPLISSIAHESVDLKARVNAGTDIFYVTAGGSTNHLLQQLAYAVPGYPLIATAGKTCQHAKETVENGADALVFHAPHPGALLRGIMENYRVGIHKLLP